MKLSIEGMHCDACVRRVRKALESVEGIHVEDVKVGSAVVTGTSENQNSAIEAIRKAGYKAQAAA
jgi:copper chaperone CopZ